jgi:dienelactone hydrolase
LGLQTRVFAYIGFPPGASESARVPAVVLVHGANGTAFPEWVKAWTDRGYAAIALDTEGRRVDGSRNGLYGPANDNLLTADRPLNEQWAYHAVYAVIAAHNLLRADTRVDGSRTGIMGVSWGSVIASVTAGVDGRFAFGISVYGGGYLDRSVSGFAYYGIGERGYELWDPSRYFPFVSAKMLFINSDHDTTFSPETTYKSAVGTGGTHIYIAEHTHGQDQATALADPYIFADEATGGQPVRARIVSAALYGGELVLTYDLPPDVALSEIRVYKKILPIIYESAGRGYAVLNEDFSLAKTPVMSDVPSKTVTARVPWSAKICYFTLVTERGGVIALVSSPLIDIT